MGSELFFMTPILILLFGFCILSYAQEKNAPRKIKRDPFIPLVTPDGRILKLKSEEQEEGLAIEGIVYDKAGLSYALVNGEPVKIGDRVGEYQVLKIQENSVIFVKEGQTKEVELKKEAE